MAIRDPLAVLCALLDRSVAQIAEASADARVFDRELISRVADVWDNNSYPLFGAAVGGNGRRTRHRAQTALRWMAEFRRDWMVDQAAIAGFALGEDLPPSPPHVPYRDYAGLVQPASQTLTTSVVEETAADYDLEAAQVTHFRAERAGLRLDARIVVAVPRRYPAGSEEPATVHLGLRDVTALTVNARDLRGLAVAPTDGGLRIALGADGFVRAATGRLAVDDLTWHKSAAGRRADAETPLRSEQPKPLPRLEARLSPTAQRAAKTLYETMIEIRSVRYPRMVDVKAVSELCALYAGAGQVLLDASRLPTAKRRDAALLQLNTTRQLWLKPSKIVSAPGPADPRAELRMITYAAPHQRYGEPVKENLLRHWAMPPDSQAPDRSPWQISITRDLEPSAFGVRTEDFQAAAFEG